jgi:predicted DNA-binding antitoxin AbrB/MazE fold protein
MTRFISAIFDSGVFRPLEPVDVAQGERVVLHVESPAAASADQVDVDTRNAWSEYIDRMEAMPDCTPSDGLTSRDHDQLIYGGAIRQSGD